MTDAATDVRKLNSAPGLESAGWTVDAAAVLRLFVVAAVLVGSLCTNHICNGLLGMGATCASDRECVSDKSGGGKCASVFATEAAYCTLP